MALTRINGNLISSGTITGNLFLSNTITGNLIAPAAVTGDKIGLTAITGNLVASATITGDKIGLNAITSNLISANAVTTAAIADGSINTSELASGAVTGDKIGLTAINANNIVDGAVTVSKGGTGLSTLTTNNVLIGNGTSAVNFVAPGTTGNVLTSNGTTWASTAPVPGSGSITATVVGSLSAGSLVQMNSNTTVQAATVSTTPSSISSQITAHSGVNSTEHALVYVPAVDRYVSFYSKASTGALTAKLGTPATDGSISFGSDVTVNGNYGTGSICAVLCKDATGEASTTVVAIQALGGGSGARIHAMTVSASSITVGSEVGTGRADGQCNLAWDRVNQRGSFVGVDGSTSHGFAAGWTVAGTTVSYGTNTTNSESSYENNVCVDESTGYHLFLKRVSSLNCQPFTVSAARAITFSSSVNIYSNTGSHAAVYVPGPNKVLVTSSNGSSGIQLFYITMTGATPSITGSTSFGATFNSQSLLGLDTTLGIVSLIHKRTSTSYLGAANFPINGTTISFGSAVTLSTSTEAIPPRQQAPFDSTRNRIAAYTGGSTHYVYTFLAGSSTLTAANYIGISSASYSDGNTGTIKTVGSLATGLTGVTPGSIMYAAGSNLTTTNTGIPVGRGVTTTSMIVSHS